MSVEWTAWAFKQQGLDPTEKLVLLALADHAGHDGSCYPGTGRIAEYASIGDRQVRQA